MTSPAERLALQRGETKRLAEEFASNINQTLKAFLGTEDNKFETEAVERKIFTRTIDRNGIYLDVEGIPRFRMSVSYRYELSESLRYLAVDQSTFNVFVIDQGPPLIRYDYLRKPKGLPGAHINFRMEGETISGALEAAGKNNKSKSRRKRGYGDGHGIGSQLHVPVGGPRFRPCLEDVLEFLVTELAVDCAPNWKEALKEGRVTWRDLQLRAAVQDNSEAAAESLRELGYTVKWSREGQVPSRREHKLGQF